jgi:hypothetical protein
MAVGMKMTCIPPPRNVMGDPSLLSPPSPVPPAHFLLLHGSLVLSQHSGLMPTSGMSIAVPSSPDVTWLPPAVIRDSAHMSPLRTLYSKQPTGSATLCHMTQLFCF